MSRVVAPILPFILFGCAAPATSVPVAANPPAASTSAATPADRAPLVADLEATRDAFLASVDGLSEAQVRWKAGPDRWSIAEVAEHIEAPRSRAPPPHRPLPDPRGHRGRLLRRPCPHPRLRPPRRADPGREGVARLPEVLTPTAPP